MADLQSGLVLANRYTLKRRLGGVGATETWLAGDKMTRASVALKILSDPAADDSLLRREWELGLRLVHANIGRVFEYQNDTHAFYSQQFIDGPDASVLAGGDPEHILSVMACIADALRYAHGKSVVHCDIKSTNILFDSVGSPYLIDFGVASRDDSHTGGGSLIASSPQRLAGETPVASDDVFALGGLIVELLTGQAPYRADHIEADIRDVVPDLDGSAAIAGLPTEVKTLLSRMLSKQASDRPAAEEVVETLRSAGYTRGVLPKSYLGARSQEAEEIADIRPMQKKASAATVPADKGRSGSNLLVGGALLVLVVLLFGVLFLLPDRVEQQRESQSASPVPSAAVEPESPSTTDAEPGVSTELPARDQRVQDRNATEQVLGELLANLETLEARAVERWGGLPYKRARATYEAGDEAYLRRDYATAQDRYREALALVRPLLEEVDRVFEKAMADGQAALAAANGGDAISAFELAVAISPNSSAAADGLARARNLDTVLDLIDQGNRLERGLELRAARDSFARAVELDPEWVPAAEGLQRLEAAIEQQEFEARMSEGLQALFEADYLTARAAFRRAQEMRPGAPQPADGLLQVDQALRLQSITSLEQDALEQVASEQWEMAAETYEALLEIDPNLSFAKEGQAQAREMLALFAQLDGYISEPDTLVSPTVMQRATQTLISITRMADIGPRLTEQRDELSRLLRRAQTPLAVTFQSDGLTTVSVFKVGRLGTFETRQLDLKPGSYTVVGSRVGYRDVRVEFRVAPEIDMQPVVVRCEEPI